MKHSLKAKQVSIATTAADYSKANIFIKDLNTRNFFASAALLRVVSEFRRLTL